jgi:peptidoglycan/xylan/chitin deacetylase (PgdA/CDA1 family)
MVMQLPTHGRYDYSPIVKRRDYSWPGGRRLAVHVALNIEYFAFGRGLGHVLGFESPPPGHRDHSWRDYGNRVGIWRLLELLDELKLPGNHLINSAVFDHCPDIPAAIRARGDEFIGHGRTNAERPGLNWEEDEARLIAEVNETIARFQGRPPRGWMAPWMSQSTVTPDLLKEAGYEFMMDWPCDDQPIWMRTRAGPILSVPYPIEINDSPLLLVRHHAPEQFAKMIVDQFEEMLRQSERQPLVCGIALHTMITGQPYRLRMLREALAHIVNHPQRDKVWFTRPGEIADYVKTLPAGTVPGS